MNKKNPRFSFFLSGSESPGASSRSSALSSPTRPSAHVSTQTGRSSYVADGGAERVPGRPQSPFDQIQDRGRDWVSLSEHHVSSRLCITRRAPQSLSLSSSSSSSTTTTTLSYSYCPRRNIFRRGL